MGGPSRLDELVSPRTERYNEYRQQVISQGKGKGGKSTPPWPPGYTPSLTSSSQGSDFLVEVESNIVRPPYFEDEQHAENGPLVQQVLSEIKSSTYKIISTISAKTQLVVESIQLVLHHVVDIINITKNNSQQLEEVKKISRENNTRLLDLQEQLLPERAEPEVEV